MATKKYPHYNMRSKNRPWDGLRRGQGPFSAKQWIRDLFKDFGRKPHTAAQKQQVIDSLFQTPDQARRAIRRLQQAWDKINERPNMKQERERKPARHIHERAQAAKIYLSEKGIPFIAGDNHA